LKANRRSRNSFRNEDDGVSVVVGAILIGAILVTLMLTIRLQFVPQWEKSSESSQMQTLQTQFISVKSDIDEHTQNLSHAALSQPINLGSEHVSIFSSAGNPRTLTFAPGSQAFALSTPKIRIISGSSTLPVGLPEVWSDIVGSQVNNLNVVSSLRLRVHELDKSHAGEWVRIKIVDTTSQPIGTLKFLISVDSPDLVLTIQTFDTDDATGNLISQTSSVVHQSTAVQDYYVNALDPNYLFNQLLSVAPIPFTLLLETNTLVADFALTALQGTGSGAVIIGASGFFAEPYNRNVATGYLELEARNRYFVPQSFILEHGAIILEQDDGAVFKVKPTMTASLTSGNITVVALTAPGLLGDSVTSSGATTATVKTTGIDRSFVSGDTPQLNLTIQTRFPELWADYWSDTLAATGLSQAAGEFNVTQNADSVDVLVLGRQPTAVPTATPNCDDCDVHLMLHTGNVLVTVED